MRGFKSHTEYRNKISGSSSFGRASDFQSEGGEFEPRLPLNAKVAQLVERNLAKVQVGSSNLLFRSEKKNMVVWESGYPSVCKTDYISSNLIATSKNKRVFSSVG